MVKSIDKIICPDCKGNGFVRVPYHEAGDEQWADCDKCENQGELKEPNFHYTQNLKQIVTEQKGKIEFLQGVCRRAGAEIKRLTQVIAEMKRSDEVKH